MPRIPLVRPVRATARRRVVVALLLVAGLLALTAGTAAAASYRFWGYFQWDPQTSEWTFAQTGPAETVPADGAVEGWRFAVADEASTKAPRTVPDFDAICVAPAAEGTKRVAVVMDFGTAADAAEGAGDVPQARGECAVVGVEATGSQVLAAVTDVRIENGVTCSLAGWPATGCGDPVQGAAPADPPGDVELALPQAATPIAAANPTADSAAEPAAEGEPADEDGFPWLLAAGVVAVAGVGVAAWARTRRTDEHKEAA